jgi:hypothetical protein
VVWRAYRAKRSFLASQDGEMTWREGLQLLAFYAMIVAVAFLLLSRPW